MTRFSLISTLMAAMALLLAACADDSSFTVRGTIEGDPTLNLRVIYYAQGAQQQLITAAREGSFEFEGRSSRPTLVEIFDNDYRLIGRLYAANGQKIECHLHRSDPYLASATGNDVVEQWSTFVRDHADVLRLGNAASNSLIADYVGTHRENPVSSLLLITSYNSRLNPVGADSLMALIESHARPTDLIEGYSMLLDRLVTAQALGEAQSLRFRDSRSDSMRTFNPSRWRWSLLTVTDHSSGRDTIVRALRRLHSNAPASARLGIVDYNADPDSLTWAQTIARDSAEWLQGWAPGSLASPGLSRLGIPDIPYYIACDSTGHQLYRGQSLTAAIDTLRRRMGLTE